MYNLILSATIAVLVFAGIRAGGFGNLSAVIPSMLAFVAANFLLARRVGKKIQDLALLAQKEIQAQRIDRGIALLEEGFRWAKWQLLIESELHSNVGILQYVKKDFDAARPHLEKAAARGPAGARAKAMLGCLHFQKKEEGPMAQAFELAVKAGRKEGLIWGTYAFCLDKLGKREDAIKVLARGVEANPSDDKLKANLVALQNEKKLKMRAWSPEWYQFHLERPPMDLAPGGRRVVFQRR